MLTSITNWQNDSFWDCISSVSFHTNSFTDSLPLIDYTRVINVAFGYIQFIENVLIILNEQYWNYKWISYAWKQNIKKMKIQLKACCNRQPSRAEWIRRHASFLSHSVFEGIFIWSWHIVMQLQNECRFHSKISIQITLSSS